MPKPPKPPDPLLRKPARDALARLARWHGKSAFTLNQKSMRRLEAAGYVELVPGAGTDAYPAWRLTRKGRRKCSAVKAGG